MNSRILLLGLALSLALPLTAAENVVLVTLDGLRWQEVFAGLDPELARHEDYSPQSERLLREFWAEDRAARARLLLPFLHHTVFARGSYVGDRTANSCAALGNPWYFSYPGYSEILSGVVNESIDSNGKFPNPEQTFLELLDGTTPFRGRTAAFASWDVFPFIFNVERSGIHVNAYHPAANPADAAERSLNALYADIPTPWPTVRNDAFTHRYALAYLKRERPRVLFISYGETDDFAHDGKYDEYLLAANRSDRFIREIWEALQSLQQYRDNTVLFITVDHGRGEQPLETWQHHASRRATTGYMQSLAQYEEGIIGSEAVWMAALGPGIASDGLVVTGSDCLTSDRVAATLLQVLGEDYRDYNAAMGAPLLPMLE